jgi:tripartite-type tricarboxylate transporter receptor subunit TctC
MDAPLPGVVARLGTPKEIVARLNAEVTKMLAQPEMRERLEREGAELIPGAPERLGALIEADLMKWRKLIAEAKVELE